MYFKGHRIVSCPVLKETIEILSCCFLWFILGFLFCLFVYLFVGFLGGTGIVVVFLWGFVVVVGFGLVLFRKKRGQKTHKRNLMNKKKMKND